MILDVLATTSTVLGVAALVVAAIGVLRLPDLYARLSAVTVACSLGISLVLLGLLLHFPSPSNAVKLGLAFLIQLATAAVVGNAVARAGYLTGAPRSPLTSRDEIPGGPPYEETLAVARADDAADPGPTDE